MKLILSMVLLVFGLAIPTQAMGQDYYRRGWRDWDHRRHFQGDEGPRWMRAPNMNGLWHYAGNPWARCFIRQAPDGRAVFTNEKGEQAYGRIVGDHLWVPGWGGGGLEGQFEGDTIQWSNGTVWTR